VRREKKPSRLRRLRPPLVAAFFTACLAGAIVAGGPGCSGWDPRSPFERNAPDVDDALHELDAGHLESAEATLETYLGTGPCRADAGISLPDAVRAKPGGSFDLGLTLFYLGERFGQRFGDEELADGGAGDEALGEKRGVEIDCALIIVRAIASDPKVPAELRARARYLAGNLEFMRRKYEDAVKEYDQALAIVPGLPLDGGGDGIGRDAAWNRAIALRRIEDQKDAGADAADADAADASDGSDGSDASDGSDGSDASDGSDGADGSDGGNDGGDGGKGDAGADGGDKGDAGSDAAGDVAPNSAEGGADPQPQPPEHASPQQDDRMLEQLEQVPSYQEQEAKQRARTRRGRPTMEDK
jgi:tetratricopeptide (TPR) repeat protein